MNIFAACSIAQNRLLALNIVVKLVLKGSGPLMVYSKIAIPGDLVESTSPHKFNEPFYLTN